MALIAAQNIKKTFILRLLFEGVSFEVNDGDKIGLVGVNGCGKTTLFRILTGNEPLDEGAVYKNREARIATMEQTVKQENLELMDAVLDVFSSLKKAERELDEVNDKLLSATGAELDKLIEKQHQLRESYEDGGGLTYKSRTRSTLLGLGFTEDELKQPLSTMSGGQRNKVQLAKVLLSNANLLLLDEPTNHLDIKSVAWLEGFLHDYKGAFIVISHDRYFLDVVTNRTFELKNTRFFVSEGNYSRHVELMSSEQETLRRKYENTKKEIRRIEGIVEQQRRFNQERNYVTAASKLKQIERLRKTLVAPEQDTKRIHFHFDATEVMATEVLLLDKVNKAFDKPVVNNASALIKNGERVFLIGDNGCGKTTLLKMLMKKLSPDSGRIVFGPRVRPGYYEQNMTSLVDENTALEEIHSAYPRMDLTEVRSALAAFLFQGDDVFKTVGSLSGGERARIQLLKLMLSSVNMLLLDEPTNHLDIASCEALERALEDYAGTMLVVTHDRYLVNRLADKVLVMDKDGLKEYIGGYDDYIAEEKRLKLVAEGKLANLPQQEAFIEAHEPEPEQMNEYKAEREHRSALNRAKGELARAEARIADTEKELAALNEELARPAIASDYVKAAELAKKVEDTEVKLSGLYSAWEEAESNVYDLM